MAIFILNTDFKSAQDEIIKKFQDNEKNTNSQSKIRTWELKGSESKGYQLHFLPPNWGVCGHFLLVNDKDTLKLSLHMHKEHSRTGDQWPQSVGALHSELVQLLLNHFTPFAEMNGAGLKVVFSYIPFKENTK